MLELLNALGTSWCAASAGAKTGKSFRRFSVQVAASASFDPTALLERFPPAPSVAHNLPCRDEQPFIPTQPTAVITSNPIFQAFSTATDSKEQTELFSIRPKKLQIDSWQITFVFQDGSEIPTPFTLPDAEFMQHWRRFARWFHRARQAKTEEDSTSNDQSRSA